MADEEIIVIEEGTSETQEPPASEQAPTDEPKPKDKKKIIIISAVAAAIVITIVSIVLLSGSDEAIDDTPIAIKTKKITEKFNEEEPVPGGLEEMIERANKLYDDGNTDEALKLFKQIAIHSESISQFNLGVIELKEGKYKEARENFRRSIDNAQNICMSAINAAVASLHLKDQNSFDYYINLAYETLPQTINMPLYSYYYTLVNYYRGNYIEALATLKHPTSDIYQDTQNKLRSKITSELGDYDDALKSLLSLSQGEDFFSIGLLYANKGDLENAKIYLNKAVMQNPKPLQEQLALSLVYLKDGLHKDASILLKDITTNHPDKAYTPYPIRVFLKESIHDPLVIQSEYRVGKNNRNANLEMMFYFAPYKIFNANQTISYLKKASANIFIDDIHGAKEYLKNSSDRSSVDFGIAEAIDKSLNFQLKEAHNDFLSLLKQNPNHSILHYNIALSYAQMQNYTKAHEHFLRSYHLDASNYLSGIFAIMTGEMVEIETHKISNILKEHLDSEPDSIERKLYMALLDISQNNIPSATKWLDEKQNDNSFYLALNTLIASDMNYDKEAKKYVDRLISLRANDIMPHILNIEILHGDKKPKAFAAAALNYLKKSDLHYRDLYFGPQIVRDKMLKLSLITGQLTPLIKKLEQELQVSTNNKVDITKALAEAYFYNKEFEKSYMMYNQLLDNYKAIDEHTLFMASCASVGAKHFDNAVALLELSKLKNPHYLDSRYALGLIYMQNKNNPAAVIQFEKMGNSGFKSKVFDFEIDAKKLYEEPTRYHSL